MKKLLLLMGWLWSMAPAMAQQVMTISPQIDKTSVPYLELTKVILTPEHTILYLTYNHDLHQKQGGDTSYLERMLEMLGGAQGGQLQGGSTIGIDPESTLKANYRGHLYSYKFLRATGIPVRPASLSVRKGDIIKFVLYYEPIEPGQNVVDFYECRSDEGWQCWNMFGVHINNPANRKIIRPGGMKGLAAPPLAANRPSAAPAAVQLSGQVFDEKTRQPIEAQVVVSARNLPPATLKTVGFTGVFRRNVAPNATYTLRASAPGYASVQVQVQVGATDADKDFYLKASSEPAVAATTPAPARPVAPPVVRATPRTQPVAAVASGPGIENIKVEVGAKMQLNNLLFQTGESTLPEAARQELDRVAGWMRQNPRVSIRLEGHTDPLGDAQENLKLSNARVEAARSYLVEKGIDAARISTRGFGGTRPLVKGTTEAQRQLNRRVELVITGT